jgi:hypothetical protein
MSNKQTAVEWLSEQFDSIVELYPSQFERVNRAIEQAKEMEKGQMIDIVYQIKHYTYFPEYTNYTQDQLVDKYYNETYGGNK